MIKTARGAALCGCRRAFARRCSLAVRQSRDKNGLRATPGRNPAAATKGCPPIYWLLVRAAPAEDCDAEGPEDPMEGELTGPLTGPLLLRPPPLYPPLYPFKPPRDSAIPPEETTAGVGPKDRVLWLGVLVKPTESLPRVGRDARIGLGI